MGAKAKSKKVTDADKALELERVLTEYAVLKDRKDAIDNMLTARKERVLLLMNDMGKGRFSSDACDAAFTQRRSFKVHDTERLAELMSPTQLASLVKVTADVYDAATREGMEIGDAVTVGISESLTVSRARTKAAKDRRKQYIEESKRQAEKRIQAAVKLLQNK